VVWVTVQSCVVWVTVDYIADQARGMRMNRIPIGQQCFILSQSNVTYNLKYSSGSKRNVR